MSAPQLSVVIPAFNEKARLPQTLRRIDEYLRGRQLRFEIVVVDDGSRDGTADAARATLGDAVTVLVNDQNRGKGFSVRRGMLAARGERRLMSDADLSTPIEELERLQRKLEEGFDVVIASRSVPGANVEVHQPALREALGRLFNSLVRLMTLPGLRDTQCGFKLFSAEVAQEAFSRARLPGFSFDVEVLYIAVRRGRRIAELPVTWRNDAATRVTLLRGMAAFLDVVRIRVLGALGAYDG
jgi:dolichyl-phosphate beta-glucosyltransferase